MLAGCEWFMEPHLEVQSTLWGAAFVVWEFMSSFMAFCQWMLASMNAQFCFVLVVNCISAEYCFVVALCAHVVKPCILCTASCRAENIQYITGHFVAVFPRTDRGNLCLHH